MNYIFIILTLIVLLVIFIFFIRSKIVSVLTFGLRIIFFFAAFLALSTIFLPVIYNTVADISLKQIGIHESITNIDNSLPTNLLNSDNNVLDLFRNFLGDEEPEDQNTSEEDSGYLEENLYSSLVDVVAFFLRAYTFVISLVIMIFLIYMSYTTSSVLEVQDLKHKNKSLEERVEKLEHLVSSMSNA